MRTSTLFVTTEGRMPEADGGFVKGDVLVDTSLEEGRISVFTDTGWIKVPQAPLLSPSLLETFISKIKTIRKRLGEIIAGEKFTDMYE